MPNSNFWNDSHQTEISDGTSIDEEKMKLPTFLVRETDAGIRRTRKFSLVKADEILLWMKLHNRVTEWVVPDDPDLHNIRPDQTTSGENGPDHRTHSVECKTAVKILSDHK